MNYIWDFMLRAEKAGMKENEILFIPAKVYSPYMELCFEDLNQKDATDRVVEVNPYYRYYCIFKNMFPPDYAECSNLRRELFDILLHHLYQIDRNMGMNRKEFYMRFLAQDIKTGNFGEEFQYGYLQLTEQEQKLFLKQILLLYDTGDSLKLFRDSVQVMFPNSSIYQNTVEREEILIYLGTNKEKEKVEKFTLIRNMFLPLRYQYKVYWENHFGILGQKETMRVGKIQLY